MTKKQIEKMKKLIDRLDDCTSSLEVLWPYKMHVENIRILLPKIVYELKDLFIEITGEDGWNNIKHPIKKITPVIGGKIKYKKGEIISFTLPNNQIIIGRYVSQSKEKIKIDIVRDSHNFFESGIGDFHKIYLTTLLNNK